jgi:hypothetical protein
MNRSALWQNDGSERWVFSESDEKPWFKEASNEIKLATFSFDWNFNKRLKPISLDRFIYPLYLLLPPVFSRLDSFLLFLIIRCIRVSPFEDWSFLALLDLLLHHTFVPQIRYLGFTTQGKKVPLTMTGDLSACKSKRTLIQLLTVNKPLFLAPLPGNKWSRFDLLVFLFASTNFWSSSKSI